MHVSAIRQRGKQKQKQRRRVVVVGEVSVGVISAVMFTCRHFFQCSARACVHVHVYKPPQVLRARVCLRNTMVLICVHTSSQVLPCPSLPKPMLHPKVRMVVMQLLLGQAQEVRNTDTQSLLSCTVLAVRENLEMHWLASCVIHCVYFTCVPPHPFGTIER